MNAFSMGIDMTTNAFDFIPSDALPLTPPDLAPFLSPVSGYAVAKIQLVFLDASGAPHYLDSSITSAQIPQVPEPTVTLLLGIGLMGVAAIRRKYKN
jgi:hypothetical protein